MPMSMHQHTPNRPLRQLAVPALLLGTALVGCQAERPVLAPVEPIWSYHDGCEQLSNNDTWEKMIPNTAIQGFGKAKVASVEKRTP